MNNVLFLPKVLRYSEKLVQILYDKGYFGFKDTAKEYVQELFYNIETTLPSCPHKSAPKYFDKYGKDMKYASFRKNKHTTWYAFFKTYYKNGEPIYLVRYVSNNHVIAQYL